MIDDKDASSSLLRLLVFQALKGWSCEALLGVIQDKSVIVRTAAARELQARTNDVDFIFEKIISLLSDKRGYIREIAAFTLGQLGTPCMPRKKDSYSHLVLLLSDGDSGVRGAAAAALGHLSYDSMPAFVESALLKLKDDKNKDVRSCVAYALGNSSGGSEAVLALKKLSNDKEISHYAELGEEILNDKKI